MKINVLDMETEDCRFTFRRSNKLPVVIEGRQFPEGAPAKGKKAVVFLSDDETRQLYNFLGDYFMPEGVPDGG